jgi:hypothetical protein
MKKIDVSLILRNVLSSIGIDYVYPIFIIGYFILNFPIINVKNLFIGKQIIFFKN